MKLSEANRLIRVGITNSEENMVLTGVNEGGDINLTMDGGWTPLLVSIEQGDGGLVLKLLELGADPNRRNESGLTPLMAAARDGRKEIVMMLLEKGADPQIKTPAGSTAYDAAVHFGHSDVARMLQTKHQKPVPPELTRQFAVFTEQHQELPEPTKQLNWDSHVTFEALLSKFEDHHNEGWRHMIDNAPNVNIADPAYGRTLLV